MRKKLLSTVALLAVAAAVAAGGPVAADDSNGNGRDFGQHGNDGNHDNDGHDGHPQDEARTATPIKHLVVIFDENSRLIITSQPTRLRKIHRASRSSRRPGTRRR